jgi:ABC-2 type transport system permease protein
MTRVFFPAVDARTPCPRRYFTSPPLGFAIVGFPHVAYIVALEWIGKLLVSPLSHWAWFVGYVGASVVRGLVVGLGVFLVTVWFAPPAFAQPVWILVFAALGAGMLGALGLIAGLWADKFDQMAAFQNFVIMPMTFLSGVFSSVHSLPAAWQAVSHLNPFFYMIDGFRRGFFGVSDVSPWISLAVVGASFAFVSGLALHLLRIGYKVRS